jgi:FMN phosphatase YigB (HAD superfamily)
VSVPARADEPVYPRRGAPSLEWLREVRCVALDYGGTIDLAVSPLLDGSREVDPACVPALRCLAGNGLMLALSSNTTPQEHRWAALEAAGIDRLFRLVLMSSCIGLRKPHPDFYTLIAAVAHCWPTEILHVGNNIETDVIGPARCGMRTALVRPNGVTSDERVRLPPGALVIRHVNELPGLLGCEAGESAQAPASEPSGPLAHVKGKERP